MNQYHVYEAIGHGKHSAVYKGRKKKSIEYFAIKSVDKSQKTKVLQEVRILHALNHPNVLKFYSWYETSAHLWLVLEYCVGGDLMSLLRQDEHLPEDSIHHLACDIVKGLQFLHSKGIIYADLKPSNILLDENGHTKLCDFGLARKLSDISKTPSSLLPQAKRGTPFYMAPELFQDGGVHSFASDLWALGCVLYECYTGRPPFVGREFTKLAKSILSDPTPPLPGNPSRPFVNLVNSLLVKDPAERLQWTELCEHAFWKTKFNAVPLPPQPAFDSMIGISHRPYLTERNGDRHPLGKNPPKSCEKETKGHSKQDENSHLGSKGGGTPVKGSASGRKNQIKSGRVMEDKLTNPSSTRAVNLLRLSRIAKSNLQKENEKENYRRALADDLQNDAEIKIENTDMELDFNENDDDETQDEPDASDIVSSTPEGNNSTLDQNQAVIEEESDCQSDTPHEGKESRIDEPSLDHTAMATPPIASPQSKNPRGKVGLVSPMESDSSKASSELSEVFWHSSDLSVRPVMPSRKAMKVPETIPSLAFDALPASDFEKISKDQFDEFSNKIVTIFSGNAIGEKQNTIRYLETISNNAEVANMITNGPVMLVLIKLLRQSKASTFRIQIVSLIGLLIRHSTYIQDDLANSGIVSVLTDSLRDRQEKVRRYAMAALGELLFYISTQSDQPKDNRGTETQHKDNRSTTGWQVPNALISHVVSVLRKGEDDVTQLYALRTIENICSQGAKWVARFTSQDVIGNLCYIFRAVGKQESARLTAGSCLVRLVRFNPPSIHTVIEKLSFKDTVSALVRGSQREQQISLNLLNVAMLGSHMFTNIGRCLMPLVEEKNLVPSLMSLIEQGSDILRGKALIFVALLCKNARRWLPHFFCNAKFLSTVDRLAKEKDDFIHHCQDAFLNIVAGTVPSLLDTITSDIQQIMGGRRHGHVSALTSRATPKTNIHLFPVVLHLLGCSSFKRRVVCHQVLQHLVNLVKHVESQFQGRDDFQITLLRVLESIVEDQSHVLQWPNVFIHEILPSLSVIYKGNKDGDARFLCLKILFDVIVIILDEPSKDVQQSEELKSISKLHLLPLYPMFIEDEDPIPVYAQKLLLMLIEFDHIKISEILQTKTVQQCFEFLLGDLANANVNNVKLCLALASAPELQTKTLSQLRVVRRIGNLLEYVNAKEMDDFMEPTLSLCRAFLLRSVYNRRGSTYSNIPTLLSDVSAEENTLIDQQQCIRDISDFGSNVGVLLELSRYQEPNVSDLASECIVLLLRVAPREGTTCFLTNLPKVTAILECWQQESFHLLVQRMLHALGYSCRQYFSHAMILSMAVSEVSKIKAIVSEINKSCISTLVSAASVVAIELDRLPRCL
ncbi:serine/threonine-protein kinase RUNKEL [Amaranthus tricolor]|uniref:serine/threonine-protein kinase RUNKEL n=1 Tax=Amaranthus tricolor TaxID=29722 RepID=UPI00258ADBBE|nr:serine/threonine-protein kinase RUNKEL [Amaranthus tricolor]XP_057538881.1 serine/threonine-protein kinase RUNKEL [Amaranthus tricolor]XP_057538882.1 serine/threonine-protein kinase RUNKEL [Amaranthus tricolor]